MNTTPSPPNDHGSEIFVAVDVLDITGVDAAKILNNLTTQNVLDLGEDSKGVETFVTDVKGKTLSHGFVIAFEDQTSDSDQPSETDQSSESGQTYHTRRLIMPKGTAAIVAAHVDRYTIREDATPIDHGDRFLAQVFPPQTDSAAIDSEKDLVQTAWLGSETPVQLIESKRKDGSTLDCTDSQFHDQRIDAGYPWFGIDLTDKNLPQEANRDDLAISFHKGCYLGQETVARLDALGQVQKRLASILLPEGIDWDAGDKVTIDGKSVVRLTSVNSTKTKALAMVRRGYFESGTTIEGEYVSSKESPSASEGEKAIPTGKLVVI